jgi:hypothetical protein
MSETWLREFDRALAAFGEDKQSLNDLLDKLLKQTQAARKNQATLPVVTVFLSTGQEVTGVLLAHSETSSRLLTLARTDNTSSLNFIASSHVIGITLHDAHKLGQLSADINVPAKLELSRQAKALGETLGTQIQLDLEDGDLSRLIANRLLETLNKALTTLQADELGKTAFSNITSINVRTDEAGVRLEGNKLLLGCKDLNSLPTAEQLQHDIEALL